MIYKNKRMQNYNKNIIAISLILILAAASYFLLFKRIPASKVIKTKSKKNFRIQQIRIINGYAWQEIVHLDIPDKDKRQIKTDMLKLTLETLLTIGSQEITPLNALDNLYISICDFYNNTNNLDIPLYFAIEIIKMQNRGLPKNIIDKHLEDIKKKLEQYGAIN